MPAKTLKPHNGTVIGKPRPGDTASMVGFLRPIIQKTDTTNAHPIKTPAPSTTKSPIKIHKPTTHINNTDTERIDQKTFNIGDFVEIRENNVIIDKGEISMVVVDMYFVETKNVAPRFWFGHHLHKMGR